MKLFLSPQSLTQNPIGPRRVRRRLLCLGHPDKIRLTSTSPELNVMDSGWDFLRANTLCNLVWDTSEDIVKAGGKA